MARSTVTFGFGFLAVLAAGWLVFPRALYVGREQPFEFRHKTHAEKSGVAQCNDCHALREDGEFAGIPKVEACVACHAEKMGTTPAEATLVNDYVKKGREIPWLEYSGQPANVWFSHAIHMRRAKLSCAECHGTDGVTDQLRPYAVDRISGYSRDIWGRSISRLRRAPHEGMRMSDCEDCHAKRGIEVGCLGCHQ